MISDLGRGYLDTYPVNVAFDHPTPRIGDPDELLWMCQEDTYPDDFFPDDRESYDRAVSLCNVCPMKIVCAALGKKRREHGVWGGVLLEFGRPVPPPPRTGGPRKGIRQAVSGTGNS